MNIVIGMTGASGSIYGVRLLEFLKKDEERHRVFLIISNWAQKTMELETGYTAAEVARLADECFDNGNLAAPVASGSFPVDAVVIVPCSMKTLAAVAQGLADSLIARTADVALKERRRLILVPRETPLNLIHLENMTRVTQAGAVLLPPMPAFYHRPRSVDDLVNQTVGKILDLLGLSHRLYEPWSGE